MREDNATSTAKQIDLFNRIHQSSLPRPEYRNTPRFQNPSRLLRHSIQSYGRRSARELHKAALSSGELVNRSFDALSIGQRKRLMLLSLILEKPNVLLLDEPTNHLDLLTLEALEKALLEFDGAIVAVSHDPTFIDKIALDIWRIETSENKTYL